MAKAVKEAAFDFSNTEASDVDEPKYSRKSKVESTPFMGWYEESWESGLAKSITIPDQAVKQAENAARTAARRFEQKYDPEGGAGVKIVTEDGGGGQTIFTFIARSKRVYNKNEE